MSLLVSGDNPYKVDGRQISQRASLLQEHLCDEQKELQALYALQALMVHMEQPASECPVITRIIPEVVYQGNTQKIVTLQQQKQKFPELTVLRLACNFKIV